MTDFSGVFWRVNYGEISEREQFRVGYVGQTAYEAYFEVAALTELISILNEAKTFPVGQISKGVTLQAVKVAAGHTSAIVIEPLSGINPEQIMRLDLATVDDLVYALQLFQTNLPEDLAPEDWDFSDLYLFNKGTRTFKDAFLPERLTEEGMQNDIFDAVQPGQPAGDSIDLRIKSRSMLSVADFGAVGDGTTDDSAAIQAAVNAAQGTELYWPNKAYRTLSSIAGLHTVKHRGTGRILADGSTFWVDPPTRGTTNTIRVSPTGSDTNDGLSTLRPMREASAALVAVSNYADSLDGSWRIIGTAGEYDGGLDFNLLGRSPEQDDFVRIYGPTVIHPAVPTMVFKYDKNPSVGFGMRAYDGVFAMLENVKFEGNFPSYSIDARRGSYLYMTNVHGLGPGKLVGGSYFFGALDYVNYYMVGGIIDGYEIGVREHGQVRRHFENASSHATATQIKNCDVGLYAKEGCGGHLDYIQVSDCNKGIEFHTHCNANTLQVMLKRNGVAFLASDSEIHNEQSMIYGSGADANGRDFVPEGFTAELSLFGWTGSNEATITTGFRPLMTLANDYTTKTVTGSIADVVTHTFTEKIRGGNYAVAGRKIEVTLVGSTTTTLIAGSRVFLYLAGTLMCEVTIPAGAPAGSDFEITFNVVCTADGNNQKTWGKIAGLNNSGTSAYAARTVDLKAPINRTVEIRVRNGDVADIVAFQIADLKA